MWELTFQATMLRKFGDLPRAEASYKAPEMLPCGGFVLSLSAFGTTGLQFPPLQLLAPSVFPAVPRHCLA